MLFRSQTERRSVWRQFDLVEGGRNRIGRAAVAAAGVGNEEQDAFGHEVRSNLYARMRCKRRSAVRRRRCSERPALSNALAGAS